MNTLTEQEMYNVNTWLQELNTKLSAHHKHRGSLEPEKLIWETNANSTAQLRHTHTARQLSTDWQKDSRGSQCV